MPVNRISRFGFVNAYLVEEEDGLTLVDTMLPRSSKQRIPRETNRGTSGRTHEIQRLIGRSCRAAVSMELLGENTILIDCDVLEADGGTRTASITGACVALHDAISTLELRPRY